MINFSSLNIISVLLRKEATALCFLVFRVNRSVELVLRCPTSVNVLFLKFFGILFKSTLCLVSNRWSCRGELVYKFLELLIIWNVSFFLLRVNFWQWIIRNRRVRGRAFSSFRKNFCFVLFCFFCFFFSSLRFNYIAKSHSNHYPPVAEEESVVLVVVSKLLVSHVNFRCASWIYVVYRAV